MREKLLPTQRIKAIRVSSNLYISISIFLKLYVMREKLLPTQRIKAIQKELAGFMLMEVLREKGEHYVEYEECYM
jgi:hypothetical protein